MKKRRIDFVCPHCRQHFSMIRDSYLIYEENSVETKRMVEGGYFVHQCSRCKKLFDLAYPLVLRFPADKQREELSLVMAEKERRIPEFDHPVVMVRRPDQFIRAFSILRLNLEIKETLEQWIYLEQIKGKGWHLRDYEQDSDTIWFERNGEWTGIRKSVKFRSNTEKQR